MRDKHFNVYIRLVKIIDQSVYLIICCFLSVQLGAQQHSDIFFTASSIGRGFVNTTDVGVMAIQGNPAGMNTLGNIGVVLSSEQRFGLSELQVVSLAAAKRIDASSVVGLTVGSFGLSKLKQQTIALSYARTLSSKLSLAVAFDVFRIDVAEFGSSNRFSFQLGGQYDISESIKIGVLIKNPVSSELNETTQYGSVYSLGFHYRIDDKVQFYSQLSKLEGTPLDFRNGLAYAAHESFDIKVGFSSSPSTIHFGLGIRLGQSVRMDAAFYRHETLGLTPALSLVFEE